MTYMAAQALLKTLLLTMTSTFATGDVTEGDLRVLDSASSSVAVLFPGAVPFLDLANMVREHQHEGFLDLYAKFVDDTSYSTFGTLRDSVLATIAGAPCLSGTYFVTGIQSDGDPLDVYDKQGGGPFWITQRLRVTIEEQV